MSVLTPKRLFLCVVAALLLTGSSALASHPSPRAYARSAFDNKNNLVVLFGGRGVFDGATGVTHGSDETWVFRGVTWAQRFPRTTPPARSVHSMVADDDGRVYMFGGRQESVEPNAPLTFLSDLWVWDGENWALIDEGSAERPAARQYAALAYDEDRDVLVLYGGQFHGQINGKDAIVSTYDTWEFANGSWTRIAVDTPKVAKPFMAYDPAGKQMLMIGVSDETTPTPLMYRYDGATQTWTQMTPAAFPTCINEGMLLRQNNGRLLFLGGICRTNTPPADEAFEFDGTTWNKLTTTFASRGLGQSAAWDTHEDRAVIFGGSLLRDPNNFTSFTNFFEDGRWLTVPESQTRPFARSLMVFEADPLRDRIWMYGGLAETGDALFLTDFWGYRNGGWFTGTAASSAPAVCDNPLGAFDIDRGKLVVLCNGNEVAEFDGATWKEFGKLDKMPTERRFAAMVYDRKLKKTILFGGYHNSNYRNDTWTWDGTKWAELDLDNDERPPHRGTMAMWYDPLAQKTILYGGIGRANLNQKVTRYSDMWSFDGARWTNMNVAQTPGIRFRPLTAVNPATGKVTIFGGLRADPVGEDRFRQFFGDDLWEWDGSTSRWTQIAQSGYRPAARQNGGLAFEPSTGELVLFGGYGKGFYYSDTWIWNGAEWRPQVELIVGRRRSVR